MPKLIIADISRQLDGEYEFDTKEFVSSLTNTELHFIKVECGVRAGEIGEAIGAVDAGLLVTLAALMLEREGKGSALELRYPLWSGTSGKVKWDFDHVSAGDGDAIPPTKEPGVKDELAGRKQTSGLASETRSESPESVQPPSGVPA